MNRGINYQAVIERVYQQIAAQENKGAVAAYIPELSKVDPNQFGVCLRTVEEEEYGFGDWQTKFSIQSIAKVLSLSMIYKRLGGSIWERVGIEPSGTPFNSLIQLETDKGIPRNPLINGGAMVICDLIISHTQDAKQEFLQFVRKVCCSNTIDYSEAIANSEKSVGYRNIALCNFIKSFGNLDNDPNEVLDFYFHMCSIEMTCAELTRTFMFLVDDYYKTADNEPVLTSNKSKRINAIMQTCGFYDESGEFSFKVGLPGKSGVGGGIVALHPDHYCIAVWSPKLNEKGNSYKGMQFLEAFTDQTDSSIF